MKKETLFFVVCCFFYIFGNKKCYYCFLIAQPTNRVSSSTFSCIQRTQLKKKKNKLIINYIHSLMPFCFVNFDIQQQQTLSYKK